MTKNTNKWIITDDSKNMRIDVFIASNNAHSRSKISEMIRSGLITCNGKKNKANYRLKVNDTVEMQPFKPRKHAFKGSFCDFTVHYEDEDLLVIYKPKGITVHPGKNTVETTLIEGLIDYFSRTNQADLKPGLVHRLDKNTSGLMVIAKNDISHHNLALQIENGTFNRVYTACVEGHFPYDAIHVEEPIGVNKHTPTLMSVTSEGKYAHSHFKLIRQFQEYSIIECILETGRTHQIRVHAQHLGYPLVGDTQYGTGRIGEKGQYLCSTQLSFIHPRTKKHFQYQISPPDSFFNISLSVDKTGLLD